MENMELSTEGVPTAIEAGADASNPKIMAFEFHGNAREYFRIWIVNLALSIFTLGIYSAWAKVRTQRYFHGNTRLDGSSFQYLANPVAILKGRVIAVAVFLVYWVCMNFYPPAMLVVGVLMGVAFPWVLVRALDFRARNTAYRNITFHYDGTYWQLMRAYVVFPFVMFSMMTAALYLNGLGFSGNFSAANAVESGGMTNQEAMAKGILLTFAVAALLFPYFFYLQNRYVLGERRFGKSRFRFDARPKAFYSTLFILALLTAVIFGVAIALAGLLTLGFKDFPVVVSFATLVPLYLGYIVIGALYKVFVRNLVVNAVEIGLSHMASSLRVGAVIRLYMTNIVAIVLSLGLLIPWAKIRMQRYQIENTKLKLMGSNEAFRGLKGKKTAAAAGEEVAGIFDVDVSI